MIAITFALPQESSGLAKCLRNPIAAGDILIVYVGVGEERSRRRIGEFFERERPSLIIAAGFAGALTDEFAVGELVFGENYSDPELLRRAAAIIPNARRVNLLTAPFVVHAPEQRQVLARSTTAQVVDMETKFISAACAERGIPMVSLRVISDTAGQSFPAPPDVLFNVRAQRTEFTRLIGYLLANPKAIPRLIRFGARVRRIRGLLTDALARLTRELCR